MLTGLRYFFMLLTLSLCTYSLATDNFTLLPYMQFALSCFFILLGINELKSERKSMGISYFFVSSLMLFIVISNYFH
ncbi:DUF3953 domain-containing protein [Bacillus toyonensis]|uniref:DUF3953 domain-containing protein n=1 Tax=Bacillus toyonensis TaxID=155322 RepID=UPI003D6628C4